MPAHQSRRTVLAIILVPVVIALALLAFDVTTYDSEAQARAAIKDRDIYGASFVTEQGPKVLTATAASPMVAQLLVFLGLDVGKGEHHACALDPSGKKLHDKALPNDEQRLRALFARLGRHGRVLVVVDQPASIGALPVAVARAEHCRVAYLPGLTMRRLADVHPGNAKTDARDADVIADAARTLPHTLRRVDADEMSAWGGGA